MPRYPVLILSALVMTVLAALQSPAAPRADESRAAGIQRIEDYLNGLGTLQARFVQNNPDGTAAQGKIYLQRPGKVRFEYDPPVPLLLVANGKWLTHVDKELKQVSNYPLDETPAYLLLRERIAFGRELRVTDFSRGDQVSRIRLEDPRNPDIGSVTLTFADRPLELRTWVVTDAQGLQTELALVNSRFGMTLDQDLFEFNETFPTSSE